LLQVENLRAGAEPETQQAVGRQQRDVMAGGAIYLDQIAPLEILDPRDVGHVCVPL